LEKSNSTIVLTQDGIRSIIEKEGIDQIMDLLISRLDDEVKNYNTATTKIPVRSGFNYTVPNPGLVEWMPIYHSGEDIVIKLVGYHPNNPSLFGIPTIASTISAYTTQTGQLKGIMDGVLPTALRTGAASAMASKYLAQPDSSVLGLIGCGAQSVTQLHALSRLFNFENVLIYDTNENAMRSFTARIECLGLSVNIEHSSINDIVEKSDIVCTATSININEGPLFENIEPKPHAHFNAVGSDFPGKTELPVSLLKKAFVSPDFLEQALQEGESQQMLKGHIGPEIDHIVKYPETHQPYQNKLTVFDSTGWALEDYVVFNLFMDLAAKHNLGKELSIEYLPDDAINPYHFLSVPVEA